MKRVVLEKHLRTCGCTPEREGGNHTIWTNPANNHVSPVPRHAELPYFTAVAICKQLGIEVIRHGR